MALVVALFLGVTLPAADGGQTAAAETTLSDAFQRTVSGGWSGSGFTYIATDGVDRLSVSPRRGLMQTSPGYTTQATLAALVAQDVATRLTFSLSAIATSGSGTYVGPMVRVGAAGSYRLSARVAVGGAVSIALERVDATKAVSVLTSSATVATVAAGQTVSLRLQATGSSSVALTGQAYLGSSGNAISTISYVDSSAARVAGAGAVAAWSYLSRQSQTGTVTVTSLTATDLAATTPTGPPEQGPEPPAAGSLPVGQAQYPAPASAVFVSPSGSDAANGKQATPYKTVTAAVNASPTGSMVVLRAGVYHETVMVPQQKTVTIQAYPGEAVWFDGSEEVTGFVKSGATWSKSGWNHTFDASPTFARGAADNTAPGWQFINSSYPMAAHPDQVWVNGARQTQVGSIASVRSGTFYVDRSAKVLYLGTDPTGKSVRASTLQLAMTVLSKNSVIRGLGFRRYAPSVPDMGAVRLFGADGSTVENVVVADNSTTGMHVGLATTSTPVRLTNLTVTGNGLLGIGSNRVNGLTASRLLVSGNNAERFNPAPSAAGFKLTRAQNVTVTDSVFKSNLATGLWFDESSVGVTVSRSDFAGNSSNGLTFELSARGRLINNAIWANADTGLFVVDSNKVDIWNNSVRGAPLPVRIADGSRKSSDSASEATWVTKDIVIRNNAIGDATPPASGTWCGIMCMLDDRRLSTAAQMNASADGNLYYRLTDGTPAYTVRWAGGTAGPRNFTTLAAFRQATGQEAHGVEVLGAGHVDERGVLRSGGSYSGAGVALPADIAAAGGLRSGAVVVGAVR